MKSVDSYTNKSPDCPAAILDYYALADPVYFRKLREKRTEWSAETGREAMFALSMLSTNFPSIHLRLEFPDGEPGTWETGRPIRLQKRDGARLSVPVQKRFSHTFPRSGVCPSGGSNHGDESRSSRAIESGDSSILRVGTLCSVEIPSIVT